MTREQILAVLGPAWGYIVTHKKKAITAAIVLGYVVVKHMPIGDAVSAALSAISILAPILE